MSAILPFLGGDFDKQPYSEPSDQQICASEDQQPYRCAGKEFFEYLHGCCNDAPPLAQIAAGARYARQGGHKALQRLGNAPADPNPSRQPKSAQNRNMCSEAESRSPRVRPSKNRFLASRSGCQCMWIFRAQRLSCRYSFQLFLEISVKQIALVLGQFSNRF